ncbi:uncharacterized protein METZ01_LOCUS207961, partial [marine metagenome]
MHEGVLPVVALVGENGFHVEGLFALKFFQVL